MKKLFYLLLLSISIVSLMSCSLGSNDDDQFDIVTTMYTQYDFAKEIAQDHMSVTMLVPLGQDIHSYEASSQDMVKIENSSIFIYTSDEIDTWINNPDSIGGDDTIVINMESYLESTSLLSNTYPLADDHDHDHENIHYWVDPINAIKMVEVIRDTLISIDPVNESDYTANANQLIANIEDASNDISDFVHTLTDEPTIYFAGHNAMEAFGDHFGIHIISIFDEFKPDADLTSAQLLTFVNEIKSANTHYLFIEALEEPKAAQTIKDELKNKDNYDLTLLELHSYHNVTQDDFEHGVTYVDLMYRNLDHIKQALGA